MTQTQNDPFAALRYDVRLGTVAYRTEDGIRSDTKDVGSVAWRTDTGKAIGLVGPAQHVVQPSTTIAVFERLLDSGHLQADGIAAYAWKGGARTCITAETGKVAEVRLRTGKREPVAHRIFDYDSFDGSSTKRFGDASYVLVCSNGMMGWRKNQEVRIRHTSSLSDRYRQAVRALRIQIDGFEDEVQKLQVLADSPLNDRGFKAILDEWFPRDEEGFRSTRAQNQADLVERLYHEGQGADPGSLWGALQAHTNYVTHHRGRDSARTEQSMVGAGANSTATVLADLYRRAAEAAAL